jgi:hypothetical protein
MTTETKADRFAGIEVDGRNVRNVIDAFRLVPRIGLEACVRHGIGRVLANGTIDVATDGWYPMDAWLALLSDILDRVGPAKMTEVGTLVPQYAVFPPHVTAHDQALESLNVAYHLNHRKHGRVMFDPAADMMLEGIGHYRFTRTGPGSGTIDCDNPYPCDFDRGIPIGLGNRFGHRTRVTHTDAGCRKTGAVRCIYDVAW